MNDDALKGFDRVGRDRGYRRWLAEPGTGEMIDIYANIGTLSLDGLSRKPHLVVHAYEPTATLSCSARKEY